MPNFGKGAEGQTPVDRGLMSGEKTFGPCWPELFGDFKCCFLSEDRRDSSERIADEANSDERGSDEEKSFVHLGWRAAATRCFCPGGGIDPDYRGAHRLRWYLRQHGDDDEDACFYSGGSGRASCGAELVRGDGDDGQVHAQVVFHDVFRCCGRSVGLGA